MMERDFDEKLVQREHLEVKPSEMDFSRICDDDQPPDLEPVVQIFMIFIQSIQDTKNKYFEWMISIYRFTVPDNQALTGSSEFTQRF